MALSARVACADDLITNGDFANTNSTWTDNTGFGSNDYNTAGGVVIPGWTNVSTATEEQWIETPNTFPDSSGTLTNSPGNGSIYFVDLTGLANNEENSGASYGGIEQTIATTDGDSYQLTFDLGNSAYYNGAGNDQGLTASATGNSVLASQLFTDPAAAGNNNEWTSETLDFTADSSSTTIEFLASDAVLSEYTGLDNVDVSTTSTVGTGVPEPATWGMLLFGLIGLGAVKRRSRNQITATA
jgi:hypothetical protein